MMFHLVFHLHVQPGMRLVHFIPRLGWYHSLWIHHRIQSVPCSGVLSMCSAQCTHHSNPRLLALALLILILASVFTLLKWLVCYVSCLPPYLSEIALQVFPTILLLAVQRTIHVWALFVVKWQSKKTKSPFSTLPHTSCGIEIDFSTQCCSGL